MDNKFTIHELFPQVVKSNKSEFSDLLFNLYEDKDYYSIEAVFDDEALAVGREAPAIVCGREKDYKSVLNDVKVLLGDFYKANKAQLSNIKEISYGFVDGDLYYIKKRRQCKTAQKKFTPEDFKEFNDVKLKAWLSVYTDAGKCEEEGIDTFALNELTEEERIRYRAFLAENFDYKKYAKYK